MINKKVYIERGFWENLINEAPNKEGLLLLTNIVGSLSYNNSIKVITDIPDDKILDDPYLNFIQNKLNSTGSFETVPPGDINARLNKLNETKHDDLNALYFLGNQMESDVKKKHYGIMSLTVFDLLKNNQKYYTGAAEMYRKGELADGFKKCEDFNTTPCNSMIIIDPYLLKEKEYNADNTEYTLKQLLDRILPKKNDGFCIPFHLAIFSQPDGSDGMVSFEHIKEVVNSVRDTDDIKVSLSLYQIKSTAIIEDGNGKGAKDKDGNYITGDFHSRHILTNSMMVNAEDGFDMFFSRNGKYFCKKWAKLEFVWPTMCDNSRKDMDNYSRWLEICYDNKKHGNITTKDNELISKCKCLGEDEENRLFAYLNHSS